MPAQKKCRTWFWNYFSSWKQVMSNLIAPFLFGSAKDGYAVREIGDEPVGMTPLFEILTERIPSPSIEEGDEFKMLVSNVDWSDYVGRIAVGKVLSGRAKIGDPIWRLRSGEEPQRSKISKIFEYSALATNDAAEGVAGNIIGLSGFEEVDIGEIWR